MVIMSDCKTIVCDKPLNLNVVGPRSVIVPADPIIWDEAKSYEYLTLVASEDFGQGYVSKKDVPAGTLLTNTEYWIPVAQFNAQLAYILGLLPVMFGCGTQDDIADFNQESGMFICGGYHDIGDGGMAVFTVEDQDDDAYYSIPMNNGKYAIYKPIGAAYLNVMGVSENNDDNSVALNKALKYRGYSDYVLRSGTYNIESSIVVSRNNITIRGEGGVAPQSPDSNPNGCVIRYNGPINSHIAAVLLSANESYAVDTASPVRGVTVSNITIDGNNKCGYGLYVSFMAYSGFLDKLFAQRCLSVGINIASAWMLNIGELIAWFNNTGIVFGVDDNGTEHSVFQVNVQYLNGHSSTESGNAANSKYSGYGIVLRYLGGVAIATIDAERNSVDLNVDGYNSVTLDNVWLEQATDTGLQSSGYVDIISLTLGQQTTVKNTGYLHIANLSGTEEYYPFEGSNDNSVSVDFCSSRIYGDGETLKTWSALRYVDELIPINDIEVNNSAYRFNYVAALNLASLVLVSNTTQQIDEFTITFGGDVSGSITIPERNWVPNEPYIVDMPRHSTGILPVNVSKTASQTTTLKAYFLMHRYFKNVNSFRD